MRSEPAPMTPDTPYWPSWPVCGWTESGMPISCAVAQTVHGEGDRGAEDDGDVDALLVHVGEALERVAHARAAVLDVRREGAADALREALAVAPDAALDEGARLSEVVPDPPRPAGLVSIWKPAR